MHKINPNLSALPQMFATGAMAPQVAAIRLMQMSRAGPFPNNRQRREMVTMTSEKVEAFSQSWMQMSQQMSRLQWQWWLGSISPLTHRAPSPMQAAEQIMSAGSEPLYKRVKANHKRLTRQ